MLDKATKRMHNAALEKVSGDTGRLRGSTKKDHDEHSVFSNLYHSSFVRLGTLRMQYNDYLWSSAEDEIIKAPEELALE